MAYLLRREAALTSCSYSLNVPLVGIGPRVCIPTQLFHLNRFPPPKPGLKSR
jgi:hypothetical protein